MHETLPKAKRISGRDALCPKPLVATPARRSAGPAPAGLTPAPATALTTAFTTTLAACGGGGEGAADGSPPPTGGPGAPPPTGSPPVTREDAARFLAQAAFGGTPAQLAALQQQGLQAWLDAELARPRSPGCVAWLRARGLDADAYRNTQEGANGMLWAQLIGAPDVLRQRMAWALSQIVVVSLQSLPGLRFKAFAAGAWYDLLLDHAFGNYRSLLAAASTNPAVGAFLSFRGNQRAGLAAPGAVPDENYARELMQLFTIGLHPLRPDGQRDSGPGVPADSYTQNDVSQLARVFTGWDLDTRQPDNAERVVVPMQQRPTRHELGEKRFLNAVIPAGTAGERSLELALDVLFAHPNVGPFIGRQLIQRLVTSQPSPAYVARVAAAFADNGRGVRGDLAAVLRAVLLDSEARSPGAAADPSFGRLREPVLRFVSWARAFGYGSADGSWAIGDLSDPGSRLGQSPLRAPSVFNFYRPGHVPPGTAMAAAGHTAPEFQITTESSVAGWINFMQRVVGSGWAGNQADWTPLLALAGNLDALLDALNATLAAAGLTAGTLNTLRTALRDIDASSDAGRLNRVKAAVLMVLACPETLVQR